MQAAHNNTAYGGDYPVRVVLDGVFNHSGDSIRWFNKEGYYTTPGAYNSTSSPWFSFYTFTHWPDQYVDFQGCCPTLPVLNYHSAALRSIIYAAPHAVVQTYLRPPYNIDGWRLDDANEVGGDLNQQVWQAVRVAAKTANPQSVLIGEVWTSAQSWLDGTQWDGAMNYNGFGFPVSEWITGQDMTGNANALPPSALQATLAQDLNTLPRPAQLAMMNSLSTHDVPRFLDRANGQIDRLDLGVMLQMTAVGAPMIYYGDEIGMTGATDPDNRRPFDWNTAHWQRGVLGLYQRLIALRRSMSALRSGSFAPLLIDDQHNLYAYGRWDAAGRAIVALNNDKQAHVVTLDARMVDARPQSVLADVLHGNNVSIDAQGMAHLTVPAHSGVILVQ